MRNNANNSDWFLKMHWYFYIISAFPSIIEAKISGRVIGKFLKRNSDQCMKHDQDLVVYCK